jgi:hypothetical protein
VTSYQVSERQDLAASLTQAIGLASPDAVAALCELRSAATPGNGCQVAHVPWGVRTAVARALRAAAADGYMPDELEALARGLEEQLRARLANS